MPGNHRKAAEKSAPANPCSRNGEKPIVDSETREKTCATFGPDVLWLIWFALGTCISYRHLGWLRTNLMSDVCASIVVVEIKMCSGLFSHPSLRVCRVPGPRKLLQSVSVHETGGPARSIDLEFFDQARCWKIRPRLRELFLLTSLSIKLRLFQLNDEALPRPTPLHHTPTPELWRKPPVRGDTPPRYDPGTGRDHSRNTPLEE